MRNKIVLFLVFFSILSQSVFAEMMLFIDQECPHCEQLILQLETQDIDQTEIQQLDINMEENLRLYLQSSQELGYTNGGVPLLIDGQNYVEGKDPILEYLGGSAITEQGAGTLSFEDSDELNQIIQDMVENKENQDSSDIIEAITSAEVDIFSSTIAILFLIGLTWLILRFCKK